MAIAVPVLDQAGQQGLLRTRWFPFAMQDPAVFQVVVLTAASHYVSMTDRPQDVPDLLYLKQNAISLINKGFGTPNAKQSDALVASVAKMASYEAM